MRALPWILALALVAPLRAGMSYEDAVTPEALLCEAPRVVLVRVDGAASGGTTQGDPPRVPVVVERTLRGMAPMMVDERWEVDWRPGFHGVDWSGPEAEAMIQEWGARPYPPPEAATRWILVVPHDGGERGFGPKYRHRASPETLRWVEEVACPE